MGFLTLVNAGAGSSEGVEEAVEVLDRAGGCEVVWTEGVEDVDRALATDETVVIAGGDGSIHLVVNRLTALGLHDRPVGILPLGTGNDLARGLGLPLDPVEAAERIVDGSPSGLPLLLSPDGEVAVNNAHVGLGVAAARRGADWKDRLGSFAYPAGSVAAGLDYPGLDVTVAVDGEPFYSGRCLALMVLLGPSAGGGFRPLAEVEVADPYLDVVVVGAGDEPGRLRLVAAAVAGRLEDDAGVTRRRARRVEVGVGGEEWELDGEFRTWADPVSLRIDDRRWRVLL